MASPLTSTRSGKGDTRAASGVLVSWIRLGVTSVIGMVQAPILFRYMPAAELGVWYLLFAVATMVNLSDLGLPAAMSRAVSYRWGRSRSAGDSTGARGPELPSVYLQLSLSRLYGSALFATSGLSLTAAVVTLPAALLYFHGALEPGPLRSGLLGPLIVFLSGIVLHLISSVPSAYLSGIGDIAWDGILRTVVQLAGLAAVWVLVPLTHSLTVLCFIFLAQGVAHVVGGQLLLRVRAPGVRLSEARPHLDAIKLMYRESLPFFLSRVGVWLTLESTLLIGAYFLGSTRIADFALLRQIVMIGANLTAGVVASASPHVSAAHAAGDRERVRGLYLGVVRYSLIANTLWSIGTLYWVHPVLDILVGPGHFLGYAVLLPLVVGTFLGYHAGAHGSLTWSLGKWPFAPITLAAGVLNIAFTTFGCSVAGFVGLAMGPALAEAFTVDWIQVLFALRRVGISTRSAFLETVLPCARYAFGLALVGGAIRWGFAPWLAHGSTNRLVLLGAAAAGIAATAVAGAVLAWFLGLLSGDRAYFLQLARTRR
jgi:O-antigen/teichoic acid export membrane protein